MNANFEYFSLTRVYFGDDQLEKVGSELKKNGNLAAFHAAKLPFPIYLPSDQFHVLFPKIPFEEVEPDAFFFSVAPYPVRKIIVSGDRDRSF